MKFRKKPVVIEALRYGGIDEHEITSIFMDAESLRYRGDVLVIPTLEGNMVCNIGDWIIKGVKGEYYPCKNDIFCMSYEPMGDDEQ